ncbi:MFS transporter (macronuclear) [Tetrahymena thermophila SB210]|uniref:MFS transporter n=1 Tax=Tetrahymena thermophila (strain SB210) TaxID=312017 RepID=Q22P27_TETTS|nr:MFS transporter [Tetrahymena thermophila SB210]EAR86984.1 MFS transporter [Tetrahymena thermophila SB210]|eukprot:XP_001007229.1 MFS transporter [Tetrahymena thermophila SB210]
MSSNNEHYKEQYANGSFKLDDCILQDTEELNAKVISTIQDERENKSTVIHSNIVNPQSEEEKAQCEQEDEPQQEKKGSKLVFFIICLSNILLNIDHGVVPAATQQIKEDLNIGDSELGFLGSLVYFGIVSAGFIAGKAYMKFPSKYVMIATIMCMVGLLFLFTFIEEINALYFVRFVTGATQVFLLVYFPVWVDLYGRDKKTIWLTLLQVGVPLGVFAGYAITAALPKSMGWRWAIYIQCISMAPTLLVFIFCKSQDIEVNMSKYDKDPQIDETSSEDDALQSENKLYIRSPSLYEILVENGSEVRRKKEKKSKDKKDKKKKKGFFQLMCILWRSKIYVAALLTIALLYFVVTGIQFWMSDYFREVLKADEKLVFGTYSFVSLTGPTLGVIFGGIITQKIGGYDHQNAKIMCIVFAVISASVACPMPFIDAFYASASLVWLLLFFGGAMVPALTGMMLSAIQTELRAFANSNSQTIQNLLGFLPAPSLYGIMNDRVGKRAGMFMLMYSTLIGVVLSICVYIFSVQEKRKQKALVSVISEDAIQNNENTGNEQLI